LINSCLNTHRIQKLLCSSDYVSYVVPAKCKSNEEYLVKGPVSVENNTTLTIRLERSSKRISPAKRGWLLLQVPGPSSRLLLKRRFYSHWHNRHISRGTTSS